MTDKTKLEAIQVQVGTSGYYSEFLLETRNNKAYIKKRFPDKKINFSEIDKAQQLLFEKPEEELKQSSPQPQPQQTRRLSVQDEKPRGRTKITIAELLNPIQ